ncbi:MAG: TonB-dependent receptor [Pseudomonadota bacterium]
MPFRFLARPITVALLFMVAHCPSALAEQVEVIEVVGQKLTRDLQDTFGSVSVVTGDELERTGVDDLRDAFRLVPNINYSPSNNGNNGISIRGINSEGVGSPGGNQQSLSSLVIDGAVQSLEGVRKGARGIWDVGSVEVLRGPQLSLGRSALAGAVVVNTKDPTPYYESSARYVVDTLGQERAVMVSGPIVEQLQFRFTAEQQLKEKQINYTDPQLDFLNDEDFYSFRGKLLFEPRAIPRLTAKLTISHAHDDPAITAVSGPNFFDRILDQVFDGVEQRINDVDNRILELDYAFDNGIELTSLTTWTQTETNFVTPSPNFDRQETRNDNDISQDLRLTYVSNSGDFKILAGAFFGSYDNDRDSLVTVTNPIGITFATTGAVITQDILNNSTCFDLDFDADGDGRWYEFFSDAFAQIDQGFNSDPRIDGFFLAQMLPALVQVGLGADVFPSEADWDNVGSLFIDLGPLSGLGIESLPLAASLFDFDQYVADDDNILNLGYDTVVNSTAGNATFTNGTLTALDATVDLNLTYPVGGAFSYPGTLRLNPDNTFDLLATNFPLDAAGIAAAVAISTPGPGFSPQYAWDFSGTYSVSTSATCDAPQTLSRLPDGPVQDLASATERRNYAGYVDLEWRFWGPLRLVAGLRYDYENFSYQENNRLAGVQVDADTVFDALLPKYGLIYDLTDNHSVGFIASRGYRGGFIDRGSVAAPRLTQVDAEFLWSYELSFRSQWWQRRIDTNANVFYYDWTNQQINIPDPATPILTLTTNAGTSRAIGAEISARARPLRELDINGSLGLLKTRFMDFETDVGTFNGNEFPEAPDISASLAATYTSPWGWYIGGDVSYQSDMFATSDLANLENRVVGSRTLMFLRVGYEDPGGTFRIQGEINNLLDRAYLSGRDINGGAYVGDERVFSISAQVWF